MNKVYGEIYLASEYDQFKLIKGNRKISCNAKLEKSIKEKGILRPIAVTSNMEIIDGQHRYMIAQKYNIPLPYYMSSSKNIDDIIDLNNASHKWTIEDYVHKYKEDGLVDYIRLEQLIKQYNYVSLGDLCSAAEGYLNNSHKSLNNIKEGKFKFYNYIELTNCLGEFEEFIYQTQVRSTAGVFNDFFNMYIIKKFALENFVKRINMKDVKRKIIGIRDSRKILKEFVEAYNYNLTEGSKNYIEYKLNKDRSVTILSERNFQSIQLDSQS